MRNIVAEGEYFDFMRSSGFFLALTAMRRLTQLLEQRMKELQPGKESGQMDVATQTEYDA